MSIIRYPTIDKDSLSIVGGDSDTADIVNSLAGSFSDSNTSVPQIVNTSNVAWQYKHTHIEFDVSDIQSLPKSAVLNLRGATHGEGGVDLYVMRAYFASEGALVNEDHRGWLRTTPGGTPDYGNKVQYADKIEAEDDDDSWITTGYNKITLNSTALADMVSRDVLQIGLISSPEVEQVTSPSDGTQYNAYGHTVNASGGDAGKRPYIEYTTKENLYIVGGSHTIIGGNIIIK